jgi:DNA-directed RNA polymerase subunit RPC12/RpoP
MSKHYYCFLCKTEIFSRKEFKNHALTHFKNNKCPYCNMTVRNLRIHLTFYHIQEKKRLLYYRDLAILCKEANDLNILKDPNLKLNKYQRYNVMKIMNKL